ncbi:hypothetical protein [Herbaspirillum huttiense]|uniref:hypothetical protein n=1 Tax=Herbaspirillum huttiense TaxID=863372 RepID=UPI0039AFC860
MRIRSAYQEKTKSTSYRVAWGDWASKDFQSVWLTLHRFVVLNGPTLDEFQADFCSPIGEKKLAQRPWVQVPGKLPINLSRVARLCRISINDLRFSHLGGLPLKDSLFLPSLRFCPKCLNAGYHTVLMSLEALRRCPIHDESLEDACKCGKPFLDGIDRSIIGGAGFCTCRRQELLSLQASRSPTISNEEVQVFRDYTKWLTRCGAHVYLKGTIDQQAETNRAIQYWSKVFRTEVPYVFDSWSSSENRVVTVHHTSLKRSSTEFVDTIVRNLAQKKRYRWYRRKMLGDSPWVSTRSTYSAICRYLRRHVVPPVHRWRTDLESFSLQYHVPEQARNNQLIRAYLFFCLYGGETNFKKLNGFHSSSNKRPDPQPASPFSMPNFIPNFLDNFRDVEGLRWIRDRAEADYLWISWKRCVEQAASQENNIIEFVRDRPKIEDSISHWSAGLKNDQYVLRIEALGYPQVAPRKRRQVSKSERRDTFSNQAKCKLKQLINSLPKRCLVFKGEKGWSTARGTLPRFPVQPCWFKKKKLLIKGNLPQLHYVIFPKDGKFFARTIELNLETSDISSRTALALLKMAVHRAQAAP